MAAKTGLAKALSQENHTGRRRPARVVELELKSRRVCAQHYLYIGRVRSLVCICSHDGRYLLQCKRERSYCRQDEINVDLASDNPSWCRIRNHDASKQTS